MGFDPLTLLTISVIALLAMGALLIALSFEEREAIALRWWGKYFLTGAVGVALLLSSPHHTNTPIRQLASAIVLVAYGLLFAGCCTFNRRPVFRPGIFLGAGLWLAFCLIVRPSAALCSAVAALLLASYCLAGAAELRFLNHDNLKLQTWAARVLAVQALFYTSRLVLGPIGMPNVRWIEKAESPWGAILGAETLVFVFIFGFLTIAMTRERVVRRYRKASLEDALTGIGNRRALSQLGQTLMDRSASKGHGFALALFDIDRFKAINDNHGHDAGDRLLVEFAALAVESLPSESLFCRVGGEEFAALLPNTDSHEARTLAEAIRTRFERCAIPGRSGPIAATVSVGITLAAQGEACLDPLFVRADSNLYRAKAWGRNRVADDSACAVQDIKPVTLVA